MGYCISHVDGIFNIKVEKQAGALAAMIKLGSEQDDFHWVRAADFNKAKSIVDVLEAWRWSPELDDDNNIVNVHFTGEKLGADEVLFQTIAPFVEKGSFLEVQGEDNCLWRWVFDGKTCKEIYAKITWD